MELIYTGIVVCREVVLFQWRFSYSIWLVLALIVGRFVLFQDVLYMSLVEVRSCGVWWALIGYPKYRCL